MAAKIADITEGLAAALGTVVGLRSTPYQPEQLNPPLAYPTLNQVRYHGAFAGGDVVSSFTITVITGRYVERTAYTLLDDYISFDGPKSIRAALEQDKTLGGICQTLIVESSLDISSLSQGDAEFLEIRFQVEVHG